MMLLVEQILNGVQLGIILFLMAAGLTLTFGIMNFVNLAHGSLFMAGAYIGLSVQSLTGSYIAGLVVAMGGTLLIGLVLEASILRRLYRRDHVDQVLCTVGLIFIFNEAARWIFGPEPRHAPVPALLNRTIELLPGVPYPAYRLAIIAIGLTAAVLLSLLISRTRTGMLIRAGASNRTMTSVMGVNIDALYGLIFGLGAALAALAGYISAPIITVYPGMGDNILILALVVVVVGGMGSIRGAFIAALLVGLIDTIGRAYLRSAIGFVLPPVAANTVAPALSSMMIYIVMALVLWIKPEGLIPAPGSKPGGAIATTIVSHPTRLRGLLAAWRLPALMTAGLVLLFLPLLSIAFDRPFWPVTGTRMMIYAIAAMSLDLLLGRTGLVSFGHALYLGVGAYVVGVLSLAGIDNGFVQLTAAMAVAAVVALPLAIVSLRTSGTFFIMITLAFAQMTFYGASSLYDLGGDDGMALTTRSSFGRFIDISNATTFYYLVLTLLVAVVLLNTRLVRSRFGEVLRGIKINETRMRALGCPTLVYKTVACAIAAAVCGLAGALLANAAEFVGPQYMEWSRSGELIVMVIMGGAGTVLGPVVGAFAFLGLEKLLSDWTLHWRLWLGIVLVAIVFFERGGLLVLFDQAQTSSEERRSRWTLHWKLRASRNVSVE